MPLGRPASRPHSWVWRRIFGSSRSNPSSGSRSGSSLARGSMLGRGDTWPLIEPPPLPGPLRLDPISGCLSRAWAARDRRSEIQTRSRISIRIPSSLRRVTIGRPTESGQDASKITCSPPSPSSSSGPRASLGRQVPPRARAAAIIRWAGGAHRRLVSGFISVASARANSNKWLRERRFNLEPLRGAHVGAGSGSARFGSARRPARRRRFVVAKMNMFSSQAASFPTAATG